MNNIEKITGRILEDARNEASLLQEDARKQIAAIGAESARQVQALTARMAETSRQDAQIRRERLESAAGLEARKMVLRQKQNLVDAAFQRAEEQLTSLSGDAYVNFLASLAAKAAPDGVGEVLLSEKDRAACGDAVVGRANALLAGQGISGALTLGAETRNISGGLILANGKVEINCSVSVLVSALREPMAGQIAALLLD